MRLNDRISAAADAPLIHNAIAPLMVSDSNASVTITSNAEDASASTVDSGVLRSPQYPAPVMAAPARIHAVTSASLIVSLPPAWRL